jgi:hypothetical protein
MADAQGDPRTVVATMTRIDRATKRAQREQERRTRTQSRRGTAPELAARYEALFEQLTRAHCVKYERVKWREILDTGLVEPAVKAHALEQKARHALANYNPGIIDSLFGLGADRRRTLNERVLIAAKKDAELYTRAKRNAEIHNLDVNLAPGVMAFDLASIQAALQAHLPVDELRAILEGVAVDLSAAGKLVVHVDVLELDALPDESVGIGEHGRSIHAVIPPAMRHELHLANVCSTILRVAVEVMSVAPVDSIQLLARCVPPPVNGYEAGNAEPILHVRISHQALSAMDLRRLEPVSAVTALGGRVNWDIQHGFSPIVIDDLALAAPRQPPPEQRLAAPA